MIIKKFCHTLTLCILCLPNVIFMSRSNNYFTPWLDLIVTEGNAPRYPVAQHPNKSPDNNLNYKNPVSHDNMEMRYAGLCANKTIYMHPGNSRRFWSYGYVELQEDYPPGCYMKYTYETRVNMDDLFIRYGFKVRGHFIGLDDNSTNCTDTDYILLDDTLGHSTYYCGPNATIEWSSGVSSFDFYFVTKPDSPRARGFYVTIESVAICGGSISLNEASGTIQSNIGLQSYPNNLICHWYFSPAAFSTEYMETVLSVGCSIFQVNDISIDANGTETCNDVLQVFYEVGSDEPISYCRDDLHNFKHIIYSKNTDMLLTFRTNNNTNDIGFSCDYETVLYAT